MDIRVYGANKVMGRSRVGWCGSIGRGGDKVRDRDQAQLEEQDRARRGQAVEVWVSCSLSTDRGICRLLTLQK